MEGKHHIQKEVMMLKEKDKIFKNLYGFEDWSLKGAMQEAYGQIRKKLSKKDLILLLKKLKAVNYVEEEAQAFLQD